MAPVEKCTPLIAMLQIPTHTFFSQSIGKEITYLEFYANFSHSFKESHRKFQNISLSVKNHKIIRDFVM